MQESLLKRNMLRNERMVNTYVDGLYMKKSIDTSEHKTGSEVYNDQRQLSGQRNNNPTRMHVPRLDLERHFKRVDIDISDIIQNSDMFRVEKVIRIHDSPANDRCETQVVKENHLAANSLTVDDIVFETVYCGFFYPGVPEEVP